MKAIFTKICVIIFLVCSATINCIKSNTFLSLNEIKTDKTDDIIKDNLDKITKAIKNDDYKFHAFETTAFLVDTFGPRLLGSQNLELAIEHLKKLLIDNKFENVKLDEVKSKMWVRGEESITLFEPRDVPCNIPMVGLGRSVAGDITAEVIVVSDYDDLDKKKDLVKDKIVLFNNIYVTF